MKKNIQKKLPENLIFQGKNGEIILKDDFKNETIWASQKQIAEIFEIDRTVVTKHIGNLFKDGEVDKKVVCAKFAHTTEHGAIDGKNQTKEVSFYNLDVILSVGYRTKSSRAIEFRKWATKTLKDHITKGFTINKNQIKNNYQNFLKAVDDLKILIGDGKISNDQVLELVKAFARTWLNLDSFDKGNLPNSGFTKKDFEENSEILYKDLENFKKDLVEKGQATELFAQEKNKGNLEGIFGNIFGGFGDEDFYETIEEKAAHFLYFVIKNHPFNDGNKRTGAFCFVWILQKTGVEFTNKITPEVLTVLTLLIAQSKPEEKDRMIGLTLLILKND